nr:MAG TPA: hypothetical protein [Caudoviricetes sp.]
MHIYLHNLTLTLGKQNNRSTTRRMAKNAIFFKDLVDFLSEEI